MSKSFGDQELFMPQSRFMLRGEVLKLYRNILRAIKKIPDDHYRQEMKDWAQRDFKKFKILEEEEAIKMMITKGKLSLRELEQIIGHAQWPLPTLRNWGEVTSP